MTAKNLSTVAVDLIEAYGNTAKNMIDAYRVGNQRVIGFVDQRWAGALENAGAKISDEVRANALSAQTKLCAYYIKGISLTTDGAQTLVTKAVELAGKGVRQVAANASQFEKRTGVTALNTLSLAVVPAAEAVNKLVGALEQKSSLLATKVAGNTTTVKRVTPFKKARSRKTA